MKVKIKVFAYAICAIVCIGAIAINQTTGSNKNVQTINHLKHIQSYFLPCNRG